MNVQLPREIWMIILEIKTRYYNYGKFSEKYFIDCEFVNKYIKKIFSIHRDHLCQVHIFHRYLLENNGKITVDEFNVVKMYYKGLLVDSMNLSWLAFSFM